MSIIRPFALALVVSGIAEAQSACRPASDSREAKMLAFFAAPIAYSPAGQVTPLGAGEIRLAFDATYVPSPGDSLRRPEECYTASKTENTELSPVFPRPRLQVGLGGGFTIEATYLPPITMFDATPNLFSAALGYAVALGEGSTVVGARAHATFGSVKGPITCGPSVIQNTNPTGTCYANEPSEDTYEPNMLGVDASVAFRVRGSIRPYLGAGFTSLRPRFQVGFTDANGLLDDQRVEVDLTRVALFGGATMQVNPRVALSAELYSVPQDVTTLRIGASYMVRAPR